MFNKKFFFLSKGAITALIVFSLLGPVALAPVEIHAKEAAFSTMASSYLVPGISEKEVEQRLSALLGVLNDKVTSDERKAAYDLLTKIVSLEKMRKEEALYDADQLEATFSARLKDYLNQLTVKYIPNSAEYAKQLSEAYAIRVPEKNPVIENIKSVLTKKDYKKITKLYKTYAEAPADAWNVLDEIYEILSNYKSLDAEKVLYNILDATSGTVAQFTIDPSTLSIQYQDPTGTGIKKLSKKQIAEYKKIWTELRKVIPDSLLKNFNELGVSTDGVDGILAFVQQLDEEGKIWKISIDPADMERRQDFANTVIHEYGHYLSLNSAQVTYTNGTMDRKSIIEDFDVYRDIFLVGKKNSYISQFYDKFWKDISIDRLADVDNHLFYFRHSEEFINSYASTSCVEDFAESFSFYVLQPAEKLTQKQQEKLDFFDTFPEIKAMKEEILANMKKNKLL